MKNKKIPMRSCVVTREKLPKGELLRIVRTTDGTIVADETGKINGRGAYIKKDSEVLLLAKKNKALERALETTIDDSVYDGCCTPLTEEEMENRINNINPLTAVSVADDWTHLANYSENKNIWDDPEALAQLFEETYFGHKGA